MQLMTGLGLCLITFSAAYDVVVSFPGREEAVAESLNRDLNWSENIVTFLELT